MFQQGQAVAIGTDIFLIGVQNQHIYKYDTITGTYTNLANIGYNVSNSTAIAVGTDIYIFGSYYNSDQNKYVCKYNTLTNTCKQLNTMPVRCSKGAAIAKGTDIYILAGNSYKGYKFDTLTKEWTELNFTFNTSDGYSMVLVNNDIFIFGLNNTSHCQIGKYDTLNDNYTVIQLELPSSFYRGSVFVIGSSIYVITGNSTKFIYEYDIINETFTKLTDLIFKYDASSAVSIDNVIYIFGGSSNNAFLAYKYDTREYFEEIEKYKYNNVEVSSEFKELQNGNIYILNGMQHKTKLLNNLSLDFYTAFLYKDNKKQKYPLYLGNGTSWEKIL